MHRRMATRLGWLMLASVLVGCGAPRPAAPSTAREPVHGPKRLAASISGNIAGFRAQLNRAAAGTLRGSDEVEELVHAGLAIADDHAVLHPQLAVQVPTLENGLWTLFPDGRMQTDWTIRPNARWHDGAPVVAEDFIFTAQIAQDPDLPEFRQTAMESVETVEALTPDTVRVTWRQPYIAADLLFSVAGPTPHGLSLPEHLLGPAYREEKVSFSQLPY